MRQPCDGFVAVSMLLVLLAGGVAMLAGGGVPHNMREHTAAIQALSIVERSARVMDALIAHSVLYPDLYGPQGAGPGHLPCPDTDAHPEMSPQLRRLSRAGPNPPCAARPELYGVVPAHITVAEFRAGVDVDSGRSYPLSYVVQSNVVNNPIGRVVNNAMLSQAGTLAQIGIERHLQGAQPLRLRAAHVHAATARRVGAWLIKQLDAAALATHGNCAAPLSCDLSAHYPADTLIIEGVTSERHWFWRNAWFKEFQLTVDSACSVYANGCRWRIVEQVLELDPDLESSPLLLRLQPMSRG